MTGMEQDGESGDLPLQGDAAARIRTLIEQAGGARRAGQSDEAVRLLHQVLAEQPHHAGALNSLGLIAIERGEADSARALLQQAVAADPGAPPIWLNLAEAHRIAGDGAAEIASLDSALAIDPYLLPAMLRKAQACERLGRLAESASVYRALAMASPDEQGLPDALRRALAHGREVVGADNDRRAAAMRGPFAKVQARYPDADFHRAHAYAEHCAGRRKIYPQQPTGGHFPFLPAIEFFDRSLLPWIGALEAATPDIARDLAALWADGDDGFQPYVAFDATQPANQWAELNHSPRWSAWFLWKDGVRQDANCARCAATAQALEAVPMLDTPGKAPTAMFSVLKPRTRIPAHTGTSNVRTTVHLPLIVPEGCGFRVGGETREWRVGEAWAFDDTIEHEAWNDSDSPRAILILDIWNPLLSEAERAVVRAIG